MIIALSIICAGLLGLLYYVVTELRASVNREQKLKAHNITIVAHIRDLEERADAVAAQPAYFFLAGLFGNSVADEINLLDHSVLNGFISVKEYNSKVEALLQPYLDIPNV